MHKQYQPFLVELHETFPSRTCPATSWVCPKVGCPIIYRNGFENNVPYSMAAFGANSPAPDKLVPSHFLCFKAQNITLLRQKWFPKDCHQFNCYIDQVLYLCLIPISFCTHISDGLSCGLEILNSSYPQSTLAPSKASLVGGFKPSQKILVIATNHLKYGWKRIILATPNQLLVYIIC